jgi:hypothetical protein
LLASLYKWNHLKHTCQNIFPYKDSDTRLNLILVNTIYYQWTRNNTIILQQRSIVKHWSDKIRQSMKLLIFTLWNYKDFTVNTINRVISSVLKMWETIVYLVEQVGLVLTAVDYSNCSDTDFCSFLQSCQTISGNVSWLGHDNFLTNPSQFIIHHSSHSLMVQAETLVESWNRISLYFSGHVFILFLIRGTVKPSVLPKDNKLKHILKHLQAKVSIVSTLKCNV